MNNAPIIDKLLQLNEQNMVSFHMPGHKNGRTYEEFPYKNFKDILYKLDTTEIPGTDNLHNAKEIIEKSQQKASKIFKSEETFFLVNGSTSGIYSMIMAATSPGDKILVDRNCHQSVINAVILGDLIPIYIYPYMDEGRGIAMGTSPDDVENQLTKHNDVKAVVLTYPNYYGIACNLKKIEEIVHKYDKILLIDEAHGAHLGLSEDLPPSALSCGADGVVQSTHKTLPSFTQSSMLHIQGDRIDRDRLKFMLRMHQSSSPSYLLLASLDFAVKVYETEGKNLMKGLLGNIKDFIQQAKDIDGIDVMGEEITGNKGVGSIDITRIWIGFPGITGYELERRLRRDFNIQMELSDRYGVLGVASIANAGEDFDKLLEGLSIISKEITGNRAKPSEGQVGGLTESPAENLLISPSGGLTENSKGNLMGNSPEGQAGSLPEKSTFKRVEQIFTPRKALYKKKTEMLLKESQGFISGEYIIPYPPGVPLIIPGEKISEEIIRQVTDIIDNGGEILGLKDRDCNRIEVIPIENAEKRIHEPVL